MRKVILNISETPDCYGEWIYFYKSEHVNNYFITHVNEKFEKDHTLLINEVKHVTVADKIKDMTPEHLVSFQKEHYERFIKPMMDSQIEAFKNSNKDRSSNKLQ